MPTEANVDDSKLINNLEPFSISNLACHVYAYTEENKKFISVSQLEYTSVVVKARNINGIINDTISL